MTKAELEQELSKVRTSYRRLKRRHDYMLTELCQLAEGLGNKPSWYSVNHTWDTAMKHKAALAVEKVAGLAMDEVW